MAGAGSSNEGGNYLQHAQGRYSHDSLHYTGGQHSVCRSCEKVYKTVSGEFAVVIQGYYKLVVFSQS